MNEIPKAAIPAGVSVSNLLCGRHAARHFGDAAQPVEAIPTCLPTWNRHCRDDGGGIGLAPSWYVLIGGATGHGKSLLALNLAGEAIAQGRSVGFVSLEMSEGLIATRLYAILTGAPVRELERGNDFSEKTTADVARMVDEIRSTTGAIFYVNRDPLFDLVEVQKLMGYYVEQGVEMLVVDYLQLVSSGDERETTREVTRISHGMRLFAKKTGAVVVGISQFNRSTSANRTESPRVQGLIGSSALENDADQVLLLDHTRYRRDKGNDRIARTWALLGKNRHGGTGEVPIEWDYRNLRVREAKPDEEGLWPDR